MSTVQDFQASALVESTKKIPELKPGYTVRVHLKVKEGQKKRIQIFEGLIIKKRGRKVENSTITVRKIASGVGVERIFPLISPTIDKIEVVKKAKVRRAHLGYLRKLTGKAARLKESFVSMGKEEVVEETPVAETTEEPKNEETVKTEEVSSPEEAPAEEVKAEETPTEKEESPVPKAEVAKEEAAPSEEKKEEASPEEK